MKKLILLFALIFIIGNVNAGSLTGEVRFYGTGQPVSGCNIVADCEGNTLNRYTFTTGSDGVFSLGNSECSYYNLMISCWGQQFSFGDYSSDEYGIFFVNKGFTDPFSYKELEPYDESIPYSDYNPNIETPTPDASYPHDSSYFTPSSEIEGFAYYYLGPGSAPSSSESQASQNNNGNVADLPNNEQASTDTSNTNRGGSSPGSKSWSSGKQKMSSEEVSRDLKTALEKGYLASAKEIESNLIYNQEVKDLCSTSCCESDGGMIFKNNPNILANCYDKDGAHWDSWGSEYSCSGGSAITGAITGNSVLNFLVGWAVKDEEKCVEKDVSEEVTIKSNDPYYKMITELAKEIILKIGKAPSSDENVNIYHATLVNNNVGELDIQISDNNKDGIFNKGDKIYFKSWSPWDEKTFGEISINYEFTDKGLDYPLDKTFVLMIYSAKTLSNNEKFDKIMQIMIINKEKSDKSLKTLEIFLKDYSMKKL